MCSEETARKSPQPKNGKINFKTLGKLELEKLINQEMRIIESHVRLIETICDTLLETAREIRKRMGMEEGAT